MKKNKFKIEVTKDELKEMFSDDPLNGWKYICWVDSEHWGDKIQVSFEMTDNILISDETFKEFGFTPTGVENTYSRGDLEITKYPYTVLITKGGETVFKGKCLYEYQLGNIIFSVK